MNRKPAAPDPDAWLFQVRALTTEPERVEQYANSVGLTTPRKRKAAARGKDSNFSRGMEAERWATREMTKEGYKLFRRTDSTGASDAEYHRARPDVVGPPIRMVQVKRVKDFRPDGLNEAVARFLGLDGKHKPTPNWDGTRESFLYSDDWGTENIVARAILHSDDQLVVTGPCNEQVYKSLTAMLERASAKAASKGKRTLKQRLLGD